MNIRVNFTPGRRIETPRSVLIGFGDIFFSERIGDQDAEFVVSSVGIHQLPSGEISISYPSKKLTNGMGIRSYFSTNPAARQFLIKLFEWRIAESGLYDIKIEEPLKDFLRINPTFNASQGNAKLNEQLL